METIDPKDSRCLSHSEIALEGEYGYIELHYFNTQDPADTSTSKLTLMLNGQNAVLLANQLNRLMAAMAGDEAMAQVIAETMAKCKPQGEC